MYCVFHHISGHLPRQIWFWKFSTKTWASVRPPLVGPNAQFFPKNNFDGPPNRFCLTRRGTFFGPLSFESLVPGEWVWRSIRCGGSAQCSCQYDQLLNPQPTLLLRGLCSFSFLRTNDPKRGLGYSLKQMGHSLDIFFLVGGMSTRIDYSNATNQWKLSHQMSQAYAVSQARKETYVVGKHNWTISNDHRWCREEKGVDTVYKTELKLRVAKSQFFYTEKNPSTKFWLKKSA